MSSLIDDLLPPSSSTPPAPPPTATTIATATPTTTTTTTTTTTPSSTAPPPALLPAAAPAPASMSASSSPPSLGSFSDSDDAHTGLLPRTSLDPALAARSVAVAVFEQKAASSSRLSKSHTSFSVSTAVAGSDDDGDAVMVVRRYRDFEWLLDALRAAFPACVIPSLPGKKMLGRFSGEFVLRRRAALERFLNFVAVHPRAGASHPLHLFLYTVGQKDFAKWAAAQVSTGSNGGASDAADGGAAASGALAPDERSALLAQIDYGSRLLHFADLVANLRTFVNAALAAASARLDASRADAAALEAMAAAGAELGSGSDPYMASVASWASDLPARQSKHLARMEARFEVVSADGAFALAVAAGADVAFKHRDKLLKAFAGVEKSLKDAKRKGSSKAAAVEAEHDALRAEIDACILDLLLEHRAIRAFRRTVLGSLVYAVAASMRPVSETARSSLKQTRGSRLA